MVLVLLRTKSHIAYECTNTCAMSILNMMSILCLYFIRFLEAERMRYPRTHFWKTFTCCGSKTIPENKTKCENCQLCKSKPCGRLFESRSTTRQTTTTVVVYFSLQRRIIKLPGFPQSMPRARYYLVEQEITNGDVQQMMDPPVFERYLFHVQLPTTKSITQYPMKNKAMYLDITVSFDIVAVNPSCNK